MSDAIIWVYELIAWAGIAIASAGVYKTLGLGPALIVIGAVIAFYAIGNQSARRNDD